MNSRYKAMAVHATYTCTVQKGDAVVPPCLRSMKIRLTITLEQVTGQQNKSHEKSLRIKLQTTPARVYVIAHV